MEGVVCPAGTFCQVEARPNWYPFDVSYIDRGRCLPFAPPGGACDVPFEGTTSFPRKADGHFFERSTLCDGKHTCTGEHVFVMPPTCVQSRDPQLGCISTQRNGCAGRPSLNECPLGLGGADDFCFLPTESDPVRNRMTRTKLEQCASVLTSFNGPNFAFRLPDGGLPDDTNFPSGNTQNVTKLELARGAQFAGSVQAMLQALWPYPVCSPRGQSDCTTFPLPVPARDPDGGLNASLGCLKPPYRHTDNVNCSTNTSVDLSFLSLNSGNGVIDYHCTWAVLHTLSFNGGAVLTAAEKRAFGELVMYISGQFDCKVWQQLCGDHPALWLADGQRPRGIRALALAGAQQRERAQLRHPLDQREHGRE